MGNLQDYGAAGIELVFGIPPAELEDAIRAGNVPPPDYREGAEPRWHEDSVLAFQRSRAVQHVMANKTAVVQERTATLHLLRQDDFSKGGTR